MDAENHDAYLGLAMAEAKAATKTAFQAAYIDRRVNENRALRRAKQFADSEQTAWWSILDSKRNAEDERKTERKAEMERRKRQEEAAAKERKRQEEEAAKERVKSLHKKLASAQLFLSAYNHTVGLKSDGTVVAAGYNFSGQCNVSGWRDIVAVSAGVEHTVGLKADGTVVAVGSNIFGRCDVSEWTDIVAVSAGIDRTVGLKADGTVVAVGSNRYVQCDVSGWRLFDHFETLDRERKEANERKRRELSGEIAAAQQRQAAAQAELANLKGLFTGKRRKELEAEIASLDRQLAELQKQLDAIRD